MERKKFIYDGEVFEEGELVLVNGKELMYCRRGDIWCGKDAMHVVYAPQDKPVFRYESQVDNVNAIWFMRSIHDGDKIEHVYDTTPYNERFINQQNEPIITEYLIDGWVVCIILMIATLIFKPVGVWSLMILCIWLKLRHNEIERIKNIRK